MTMFPTDLPVIAISRCLLGQRVRYDGGDRRQPYLADFVASRLPLLPLCPEWEAGLGVPRSPIRLRSNNDEVRALTLTGDLDKTAPLRAACRGCGPRLLAVDGLILKSRSPSCAIDDAPLYPATASNDMAGPIPVGPGLLLRWAAEADALPRCDENRLAHRDDRDRFFTEVFLHWRRRQGADDERWRRVQPLLLRLIEAR